MAEKMKNCKVCGEPIAKSAKVCPHCGAKNKKHTVLGIVILIFGICLLIGAISGGGDEPKKIEDSSATGNIDSDSSGENQPSTQDQKDSADVSTQQSTFGVGEKVELNNIVVTLVNVSENNGANYMTPTDGNVFIVCEFEIENNSDQEIAVSSLLSFDTYVDDYSTGLSLSGMLSTDKQQLDGTVAGGKKMNGVVGYEAAEDWSNLEIHFTPDFWSGKDIVFTYSK